MTEFKTELLRSRITNFTLAREGLLSIAENLHAELEAIQGDRYLTPDQRALELQRARDEARARIKDSAELARGTAAVLSQELGEQLGTLKADEAAKLQLRRLLDQGVAIGTVVDRARERGNGALLLAAREELEFLAVPGRNGQPRFVEAPELSVRAARAIAELAGEDGKVLSQAIDLTESPGVREAERFVLRTVTGDETAPLARMEYAYSQSPTHQDATGQGGDGESGGDAQ